VSGKPGFQQEADTELFFNVRSDYQRLVGLICTAVIEDRIGEKSDIR
jgi:hypothetical protein